MKPKPKPKTHRQPMIGTMHLDLAIDMDYELVRLAQVIDGDAKGTQGDAINAILCGVGHNLRKILARLRALLYLPTGEAWIAIQAFLVHLGVIANAQYALGTD